MGGGDSGIPSDCLFHGELNMTAEEYHSEWKQEWAEKNRVWKAEFETLVGRTIASVEYENHTLNFTDGSSFEFGDHYDEGGLYWNIIERDA